MIIEQISDIHFGATNDDERLYKELMETFLTHCILTQPDIIVICGDCYHKTVSVQSQTNILFNKFIYSLVENTKSIIILIEGTDSHDKKQINALSHYSSERFFIINTVSILNILGLKLLILPEEYVKGKGYYEKYLKEICDFAFGHGMFKHVSFNNDNNELGDLSSKNFVFDYSMFEKIIKYYVGFGHIHKHSVYKKIIYSGSYSRIAFGEEEPKGWVEYHLDEITKKCTFKFIENKNAPTFTSILASTLPEDTDNLLKQLRNYSECNDFVRIVIDINLDDAKYNTIAGFVKNHNNCCVLRKVKNDIVKLNKEIEKNMKEKQNKLNEKMKDYNNLSFIEITQKIAKKDYNLDVDADYINKILNSSL